MADNFPIDIDCKKIIEWLTERKKLPKEWLAKLKAITLKASDMFTKTSFNNTQIDDFLRKNKENIYYHNIEKICNMLKQSDEAKNVNFLGNYTSKTINEWLTLKKVYEKDFLNVADMAKILHQYVSFEFPSLKKNIQSFENQLQELESKEQEHKNSIKIAEKDYKLSCNKLGILGEDLTTEIPALTTQLPSVFDEIVTMLKAEDYKLALDYYYAYSIYVNPKVNIDQIKLRYLEYLMTYGDDLIDVYNARLNGQEITENLLKMNENRYAKLLKGTKIVHNPAAIDYQITTVSNQASSGINWDGFEILDQTTSTLNDKKIFEQNDFEIIDNQPTNITEELPENDTILVGIETRNDLLCNLNELLYFIRQRISETKILTSNPILQTYDHGDKSKVLDISLDKLIQIQEMLNKTLALLTNYKVRQLLIIKEQPKAQDRIINQLNQFKVIASKNRENLLNVDKKRSEIQLAINESKDRLKELTQESLEIKELIELHMKNLIKKNIRIIGDVNKLKSLV